jgi:O-antigen/teichoic acid export membrane protein
MPEATSHPPGRGLRQRASRGVLVSLVGQGAGQLIRLASNLILTRLLFPEAFGVMALVLLVLAGIEQIVNVGVQAALIRDPRSEEPSFASTAWTIQVSRGFLMWLIGVALAPIAAHLYAEPQLLELLPAASFVAVLKGLTSTRMQLLTRHLQLGRRVGIEIAGQLIGIVPMIAWAWLLPSAWALVVGGLANQVAITVLSHVAIPGRPDRFGWDEESARSLFSFGRWVFASSTLSFLASQVDVALLGRLVPAGVLGVYSIAMIIPNLLREVLIGRIANSVMMPALAEANRRSTAELRVGYALARGMLLPVGLVAALGAAVAAPAFFAALYDERYVDAGWIAQLAMIRFWFSYLQSIGCLTLLALGDARSWAISSAVGTLGVAAGCWFGFSFAELPGLLVGAALGTALSHAVPSFELWRIGVASPLPDLGYSALALALAALAFGATHWLEARAWFGGGALATLVVGGLVVAPFGVWCARRVLRELELR